MGLKLGSGVQLGDSVGEKLGARIKYKKKGTRQNYSHIVNVECL